MNLITNRCLGAYIYRDVLHEQYKNPFIWTGIETPDFQRLFEFYDSIDFNKTIIGAENPQELKHFYLVIDGKVRVDYSHVLFERTATSPILRGNNIYYNKPWEYIVDKYAERLLRMIEPPVFMFMDIDFNRDYDISDIAYRCKKPLKVITCDKDFPVNEFVTTLLVEHKDWRTVEWWKYMFNNYLADIQRLVSG